MQKALTQRLSDIWCLLLMVISVQGEQDSVIWESLSSVPVLS